MSNSENELRDNRREYMKLNRRLTEETRYLEDLQRRMAKAKAKIESLEIDIKMIEELMK